MKNYIFILFPLLVISGCKSGYIVRLTSDYFPMETGNEWIYVGNSGDTVSAKVINDTLLNGDTVWVYEFLGEIHLLNKMPEAIFKRYITTVFKFGQEFVLEDRFGLYMEIPPVSKNIWAETFINALILGMDSISIVRNISGAVDFIGTLIVKNTTYDEVYRVSVYNTWDLSGSEGVEVGFDSLAYYLAPDIGPVMIYKNFFWGSQVIRDTFRLIRYSLR